MAYNNSKMITPQSSDANIDIATPSSTIERVVSEETPTNVPEESKEE